jgi:hypothetical protein
VILGAHAFGVVIDETDRPVALITHPDLERGVSAGARALLGDLRWVLPPTLLLPHRTPAHHLASRFVQKALAAGARGVIVVADGVAETHAGSPLIVGVLPAAAIAGPAFPTGSVQYPGAPWGMVQRDPADEPLVERTLELILGSQLPGDPDTGELIVACGTCGYSNRFRRWPDPPPPACQNLSPPSHAVQLP